MSRIGKKPITLPKGVTVTIAERELEVKGPKGTLKTPIPAGDQFQARRRGVARRAYGRRTVSPAWSGSRTGQQRNCRGHRRFQQANGRSRRWLQSRCAGKKDLFSLGYSHPIEFPLPEGVEAKAERLTTKGSIQQYQTTLTLTSIDKQKLGQVAAEMHQLRKPDAYKGKGIRYVGVAIKLKPGKTGK